MEISSGIFVGETYPTFFIAEIGQNHQGNLQLAKDMILAAKKSGANCVKFQKSNLEAKFTQTALNRPYLTKNSWGKTYRDHKEYLEFSKEQYFELKEFAAAQDILLTASGMDLPSVDFLCDELKVPFLKIGSGDANNINLIEHAATKYIPLIISTGMQDFNMVKSIHKAVTKYHNKLVILHCISSYPLRADDINLKVLQKYQEFFPDVQIGYSGHEMGLDTCIAAVALGARVIERHFTMDHQQIGSSDHQCSLIPREFRNMVSRVRNVEASFGIPIKRFMVSEISCSQKLGKSIVLVRSKQQGEVLRLEDLVLKVADPNGVDGAKIESIIGKKINRDLEKDDVILMEDLIYFY